MDPCATLNYASDSGVARICQWGGGGGANATERGEGCEVWGRFVLLLGDMLSYHLLSLYESYLFISRLL